MFADTCSNTCLYRQKIVSDKFIHYTFFNKTLDQLEFAKLYKLDGCYIDIYMYPFFFQLYMFEIKKIDSSFSAPENVSFRIKTTLLQNMYKTYGMVKQQTIKIIIMSSPTPPATVPAMIFSVLVQPDEATKHIKKQIKCTKTV